MYMNFIPDIIKTLTRTHIKAIITMKHYIKLHTQYTHITLTIGRQILKKRHLPINQTTRIKSTSNEKSTHIHIVFQRNLSRGGYSSMRPFNK